jgi:hypothetical protein
VVQDSFKVHLIGIRRLARDAKRHDGVRDDADRRLDTGDLISGNVHQAGEIHCIGHAGRHWLPGASEHVPCILNHRAEPAHHRAGAVCVTGGQRGALRLTLIGR